MNYKESREYLNSLSKYGSVLGLESITSLMKRLDNPQNKVSVIHFAGTNGKGSTIAYTESILRAAGYNVGKYTSPAVFHEREIIQIDGEYISEEKYAEYMSKIKKAADDMVSCGEAHPTPFEVETALAFMSFYNSKCDVVLLETGMGGETDATNIVEKVICSVITSVSMDHMGFLGNNIEKIAKVKAGIIKEGCPVVLSRQTKVVTKVVRAVAERMNSRVIIPGDFSNLRVDDEMTTVFDYKSEGFCSSLPANESDSELNINKESILGAHKEEVVVSKGITFFNIKTRMMGVHQPVNATTAIEVARVLEEQGFILKRYIKKGIEKAFVPGRMEKIYDNPLVIIDGAHNPGAAQELRTSLQMYFTNRRIAFIMGVLADKDYQKVAEIMSPLANMIFTVTPNNPRALEAEILKETVQKYNSNVVAAPTMEAALAKAVVKARNGEVDVIVAFGSLSYLSDIKSMLTNQ